MSATDGDTVAPLAPQSLVSARLGPAISSNLFAILMLGALVMQYWHYLTGSLYKKDTRATKIILNLAVLFAVIQSSLVWWEVVHYATTQRRSAEQLFGEQTRVGYFDLTFVGIEEALVQLFLAHRATALMGRTKWRYAYWAAVIVGVLCAFAGSVFYLAGSISVAAGNYALNSIYSLTVGLWFWGSAFTDILITTTLVMTLRGKMSHFSSQTDSLLGQLIRLAITSAAPTAALSLVAAITSQVPFTGQMQNFAAAFWVPPGMYAMGMMANLNGRARAREAHSKTVSVPAAPPTATAAAFGPASTAKATSGGLAPPATWFEGSVKALNSSCESHPSVSDKSEAV